MLPRAPVTPAIVPPRSTLSLAAMSSAVNGSNAAICIDDVSINTSTTAESCIVLNDDHRDDYHIDDDHREDYHRDDEYREDYH